MTRSQTTLLVTVLVLVGIILAVAVHCLITFASIWVINGLFDVDISSKFWHIFAGLFICGIISNNV